MCKYLQTYHLDLHFLVTYSSKYKIWAKFKYELLISGALCMLIINAFKYIWLTLVLSFQGWGESGGGILVTY
jgi:hypothetical protein